MSKKTDNEAAAIDRFMSFVDRVYSSADKISEDEIFHFKLSANAFSVLVGLTPWLLPALTATEQKLLYSMVSRNTIAGLFGVTPSRISQLVSDDVLHPVDGRFMLWQAVIEHAEHVKSHGSAGRPYGS